MAQRILLAALAAAVLMLGGCSTKKEYEPQNTHGDLSSYGCEAVQDVSQAGATLENGRYIDKNGNTGTLKEGYILVGSTQDRAVQADANGNVYVGEKKITLQDRVINASVYDDKLAFITAQNRYGVYDLTNDGIVFQNVGPDVTAINTKTVAPLKLDDLLIFATLEGSLVVTDGKKILREITVTPSGEFSNIIYMGILNDTLIAATASDILALGQNRVFRESYKTADIVTDEQYLYLFTKDGHLYQLDEDLKQIKKGSFQFANFVSAQTIKGNIYAVEKAGFMLQFNKNLDYKVYETESIDELSFFTNDTFLHGGSCYSP
jgi:hypothetical protein